MQQEREVNKTETAIDAGPQPSAALEPVPAELDQAEDQRLPAWLRESGPMGNPASVPARLLGKALSLWRARQKRAYIGSCHVY